VKPGEPFWVGLRQTIRPKWHTYWKNQGESGLPRRGSGHGHTMRPPRRESKGGAIEPFPLTPRNLDRAIPETRQPGTKARPDVCQNSSGTKA
jgi:hypothetical protein